MQMQEDMERVERRISAVVCIALCVLGISVQIAATMLLTVFLRENAGYVYLFLQFLTIVCAVKVSNRPGSPSFRLAWMCLLSAFPVGGMILFLLWGGVNQAKSLSLKKILPTPPEPQQREKYEENLCLLRMRSPAWGRLAAYLQKRSCWLYRSTSARYFPDGAAFFDDLIRSLKLARRYIFLEYYILAEGQIWNRIFAALKERTAAGIGVYVIFDDFGNLFRFSGNSLRALQDAGIHVQMFNPVHHMIPRAYFNYRDHRKIAVIDGAVAYTGGINLADEYANLIERYGHWKDSGVRIDGEGAAGFTAIFLRMWKRLGRSLPHEDSYYAFHDGEQNSSRAGENSYDTSRAGEQNSDNISHAGENIPAESDGFCQPFSDGPMRRPDNPIEETYLQLISSAQRSLFLTTPYYAVEEAMQEALCIAADAGVDVRLCVPAIPDHKLVYLVAETYWGELLRHGVRIYKYTPGFLHAKSVVADCETALIGTTNMDYRTFQLHYECGVLLYHMPVVHDILRDFQQIMAQSTEYTMEEWENRSFPRRTAAALLKLGAIWL